MTEIDIRKLPIVREDEAYTEAKNLLWQRKHEEGIKMTEELLLEIKRQVLKDMEAYKKSHFGYDWMDFGKNFIDHTYLGVEEKENNYPIRVMTDPKIQANIFNELQPYFYDRNGLWWLWNLGECCWELVDEVDILNMISDSTGTDVISPSKRSLILNTLKQEGRKNIPKDVKKTWIQFKDEIYDIETGETFKATSKYFVTNPIPWELEKESCDTPKMDKIFEEWVGKENVETLYEILAYSLLPDYPIHRIFCFIGSGMNGKSCFLNLLRKFIGKSNCCSTELDTLLSSRFEVTRLHKKLVCQMGETNFNEMSKTSLLKKLSGGDLIGFEYKNKTPFEENNYAKIIIATNNLPTTTDKTIGFYRRWMIIDFPNLFNEKKDILDDIPDEEYKSLALRCSVTLKSLLDKREFTNEGTIEERMEKYESKSNFLETFLNKFTTQNVDSYITKADFYRKFSEWCKESRHREMAENSVGMSMKKLGIETEKRHFSWLFDGKGGQLRCWIGIKWKE
jgi:P4 family phage/plasmid primase-like protien